MCRAGCHWLTLRCDCSNKQILPSGSAAQRLTSTASAVKGTSQYSENMVTTAFSTRCA